MALGEFESMLKAARWQYEKKNWMKCLAKCRSILDERSDDYRLNFLMGLSHCRSGNMDEGIELIEDTLRKNPSLEMFNFIHYFNLPSYGKTKVDKYDLQFSLIMEHSVTDSYLISYPKCGRTWLRLMLGCYILGTTKNENPLELLELTYTLPDFQNVHITHDDYPHLKPIDKLCEDKSAYSLKQVLYLVRDPRDVLVSNYFQYTLRKDEKIAGDKFEGDLSDFIRYPIGGLHSLVKFYNIWAENRTTPKAFHLVFYEDLLKDTKKIFLECVAFLGWPQRSEALVDEIVHFARFENMRMLEETGAIKSFRLTPLKRGDPEAFKVRKGKAGGYRSYMSPQDIEFVDRYLEENLDELYSRYKYRSKPDQGAPGEDVPSEDTPSEEITHATLSEISAVKPESTDRGEASRPAAFTRGDPSPRYRKLLADYRTLHAEGEQSRGMSAEETFAGASLRFRLVPIKQLVEQVGAKTLLDYGSGKGLLYRKTPLRFSDGRQYENIASYWGIERTTCFDPGYAPFSQRPVGTFDIVVCTDVLEHCPEEDMDWILEDIAGYARLGVFMAIACYPAHKTLPSGENAHATQRPPSWWRQRIERAMAFRAGLVWHATFDEKSADRYEITNMRGTSPTD